MATSSLPLSQMPPARVSLCTPTDALQTNGGGCTLLWSYHGRLTRPCSSWAAHIAPISRQRLSTNSLSPTLVRVHDSRTGSLVSRCLPCCILEQENGRRTRWGVKNGPHVQMDLCARISPFLLSSSFFSFSLSGGRMSVLFFLFRSLSHLFSTGRNVNFCEHVINLFMHGRRRMESSFDRGVSLGKLGCTDAG